MPAKPARVLVKGERVWFVRGGQEYEVARVTPCAAYVFKVFDPPRQIEVTRPDGTVTKILAHRGQIEPGISRAAFVHRNEPQCGCPDCRQAAASVVGVGESTS